LNYGKRVKEVMQIRPTATLLLPTFLVFVKVLQKSRQGEAVWYPNEIIAKLHRNNVHPPSPLVSYEVLFFLLNRQIFF